MDNKVIIPYLKELNTSNALPEDYSCIIVECRRDKERRLEISTATLGDINDLAEAINLTIKDKRWAAFIEVMSRVKIKGWRVFRWIRK